MFKSGFKTKPDLASAIQQPEYGQKKGLVPERYNNSNLSMRTYLERCALIPEKLKLLLFR